MGVCVFIGPTLEREAASATLAATYLPPVRQGDVYRVVTDRRPRAIGIIDGYFQHVPSVWHKEILWAIDCGVHVFGSASMGALRAAELAAYGMRGVGMIYAAYEEGVLAPYCQERFEDDDEVAVLHAPADAGYITVSEAMVNIRCTLAAACRDGVVDEATRDALARAAKAMFFGERSYENLLSAAALPVEEAERLRAWLQRGRVNQKRLDALAMLDEMREFLAADPEPARLEHRFEPTEMWERGKDAFPPANDPSDGSSSAAGEVLDELRLDPDAYVQARRAALLRMLASEAAKQRGIELERAELLSVVDSFRRETELLDRASVDAWLQDNQLDLNAFDEMMENEACLTRVEKQVEPALERYILDQLRLSGGYSRLASRARSKCENIDGRVSGDTGIDRLMLYDWYFRSRLEQAMPADVSAYAASVGFADEDAFHRALLAEYAFCKAGE